MARQQGRNQTGGANPIAGGIVGAVLFLVGFGFTHVLKSGKVSQVIGSGGVATPGDWQVVGWVFYRMHYVGSTYTVSGAGQSGSEALDIASAPGWAAVWDGWLLAVPPLLLVAGGLLLGRQGGPVDAVGGAKRGAALAIGYLPLALIGAYAVRWRTSQSGFGGTVSAVAGPDLVEAGLIAGLGYPLLFGALGGAAVAVASGGGSPANRPRRQGAPRDGTGQPRNGRPADRRDDGRRTRRGTDRQASDPSRGDQGGNDRRRDERRDPADGDRHRDQRRDRTEDDRRREGRRDRRDGSRGEDQGSGRRERSDRDRRDE